MAVFVWKSKAPSSPSLFWALPPVCNYLQEFLGCWTWWWVPRLNVIQVGGIYKQWWAASGAWRGCVPGCYTVV